MLNPRFDVFGDTMNMASRMESLGEPNRIHVSQAFADTLPLVRALGFLFSVLPRIQMVMTVVLSENQELSTK